MVSMLSGEDIRIRNINDNFSICSPQIGKYTAKAVNCCSKEHQHSQGMGLLPKNRLKHGILHELWSKTLRAAYFLVGQSHLPYNSSLNISLGPSWQSPTASLAQSSDIKCIQTDTCWRSQAKVTQSSMHAIQWLWINLAGMAKTYSYLNSWFKWETVHLRKRHILVVLISLQFSLTQTGFTVLW